jgi:hypothetical protein
MPAAGRIQKAVSFHLERRHHALQIGAFLPCENDAGLLVEERTTTSAEISIAIFRASYYLLRKSLELMDMKSVWGANPLLRDRVVGADLPFTGQIWSPEHQRRENAANGPNVNPVTVLFRPKQEFRRPVPAVSDKQTLTEGCTVVPLGNLHRDVLRHVDVFAKFSRETEIRLSKLPVLAY